MSRDYTIGAADADTGVAVNAAAPNAGAVVKVPDYTDVMDGPKTFIEFANSLPGGGGLTVTSTVTPVNPADPAVVGSSAEAARADHVHLRELPAVTAANNGNVLAVVAGAWASAAPPTPGLKAQVIGAAAYQALVTAGTVDPSTLYVVQGA